MAHRYYGLERHIPANLTVAQRNTIHAAIMALTPQNTSLPCWIAHERIRLDNDAMIVEAFWQDGDVTLEKFIDYIAAAMGVASNTVTTTTTTPVYGTLVVFIRAGLARFRMIQFGGAAPTREQSGQAANQYVKDNAAAWGEA